MNNTEDKVWSQCNDCFDGDHEKCTHKCKCCTKDSETPKSEWEEEYKMPSREIDGETWIRLVDHENLLQQQTEKIRESEWMRCIDVLNKDHTQCPIKETCIGYGSAQSDLLNNPPPSSLTRKTS